MSEAGRAFAFGDDIDTDLLAPGYLMKRPIEELARHCLEGADPGFAGAVRPGDYVVAGSNFGIGSSREQAAIALKLLGVRAVVAVSFARIFYRNAMNIGLPAIVLPQAREIASGDRIVVDPAGGIIDNRSSARRYLFQPIPPHLLSIIEDGGLIAHLKKRLALAATAADLP